jgi:hypothetical protein
MAWRLLNVFPNTTSHRAGWMARVTSSERSWRSFSTSTMQNARIRLTYQVSQVRPRPTRP